MIRYALRCEDHGHSFESWFGSAAAYDRLAETGALACPACGSPRVAKALMAPSVAAAAPKPAAATPPEAAAPGAPAATRPSLTAPSHPLEAALRALRAHVEANAESVGRDFARVAREMHDGLQDPRPVYGEATAEEARALIEDEIPVLPLPFPTRRDA